MRSVWHGDDRLVRLKRLCERTACQKIIGRPAAIHLKLWSGRKDEASPPSRGSHETSRHVLRIPDRSAEASEKREMRRSVLLYGIMETPKKISGSREAKTEWQDSFGERERWKMCRTSWRRCPSEREKKRIFSSPKGSRAVRDDEELALKYTSSLMRHGWACVPAMYQLNGSVVKEREREALLPGNGAIILSKDIRA